MKPFNLLKIFTLLIAAAAYSSENKQQAEEMKSEPANEKDLFFLY